MADRSTATKASPSRGQSRTASRTSDDSTDPPTSPGAVVRPGAASPIDLAEIDRLIEAGEDVAAHRMLSTWYWKHPEQRSRFREPLELLADRIYLRSQPHYADAYIVQAGDVLQSIAREYDVTWQYLSTLNHVDPRRLRTGQKLKVIKGPFAAVVDLSDFELTIHAHGYFVKRYDVGIGRDGATPIGTFRVQDKLMDPTYYGQDEVIEHDDPENPLGERWIGLGDSYGIHGTIDPRSIGKAESRGCIRLQTADVEEVYDFLTIGSEVVIRR
jgi:LysM repeat protein